MAYLVGLDQLLILKHMSHSGGDGDLFPSLEGVLGILDGGVEFVSGGLRNSTDKLLGSLYESMNIIHNEREDMVVNGTYRVNNVEG